MHILTIGMVLIFIYTIQRIKIHQNRCSVNFYDGCFILKPIACLSLIMLAGNVGNWAIWGSLHFPRQNATWESIN